MNRTTAVWSLAALSLTVLGWRHSVLSRAREDLRQLSAAAGPWKAPVNHPSRPVGDGFPIPAAKDGAPASPAPALIPASANGPWRTVGSPVPRKGETGDRGGPSAGGSQSKSSPPAPDSISLPAAAWLGKTLSLPQLRASVEQSGFSPTLEREFRAVAAAARMGADSEERLAWVLEACGSTEERSAALAHVTRLWAAQDMNDAGGWLDRQPPGPEKDAATAAFAREALRREPPTAVDWALSVSDPAARRALVQEIAESWRAQDPAAAGLYLQTKGLNGAEGSPPAPESRTP